MCFAAHPSGRQPFAVPFREQRIEVKVEIASGQPQGGSSFPCSQQNRVDKIVGDLARPRLTGDERARIAAKPRRALTMGKVIIRTGVSSAGGLALNLHSP